MQINGPIVNLSSKSDVLATEPSGLDSIPWDTGNVDIPWDAGGHHKCGQVVVQLPMVFLLLYMDKFFFG